jgi:multidrug efflux pump subunit AcrA (membrane-fusion protein)
MLEEADKEKARRQAVAEEAKARASQAEKERIARENAKRDAEAKAKRMAEAAERRRRQREEEKEKNKADREKNRNKSKKSSCFSPMSEFKMADGTIKQIKDIKIGDVVELGGKVSMVMQGDGLTAKWYTYGSTKVTSTHAVYENNNWTRVGTAKQSVLIDTVEPTLITLVNENHRLVAKDGVIFTDYDEVDNTGIEDDLLLELNKS